MRTLKGLGSIVIFTLFITQGTFAQGYLFYQETGTFTFGPRTGFTTSIINAKEDGFGNPKIRLSFMGGLFGRYQLSERWAVQLEGSYSPRGSGFSSSPQIDLAYFDVPVMLVYNVRYKMFKKPFTFDMMVGAQPSFLLTAESGDADVSNSFESTGFELVIGSGFPMGRFMFFGTTKIGLGDISSTAIPTVGKLTNIVTEWTLGYRFGGANSAHTASTSE